MVAKGTGHVDGGTEGVRAQVQTAAQVASGGIASSRDMTRLGGAMINDLINGSMTGKIANPVVRTGNMMLRATEMEQKHNDGKPIPMA
jgi:hypothetical protein